MSALIGISRESFGTYERGRSQPKDFFYERMLELYVIDLRQPDNLHKIVFQDPHKVPPDVYKYLSELEIGEAKAEKE